MGNTDVRFENEANMIQELGGEVWWVKRGQLSMWFRNVSGHWTKIKDVHASQNGHGQIQILMLYLKITQQ